MSSYVELYDYVEVYDRRGVGLCVDVYIVIV